MLKYEPPNGEKTQPLFSSFFFPYTHKTKKQQTATTNIKNKKKLLKFESPNGEKNTTAIFFFFFFPFYFFLFERHIWYQYDVLLLSASHAQQKKMKIVEKPRPRSYIVDIKYSSVIYTSYKSMSMKGLVYIWLESKWMLKMINSCFNSFHHK